MESETRPDLRSLAAKAPEGPWFAAEDQADDARPHKGSGLALVDTGRADDWPIARLTEWHTARYIAAVDPQTVIRHLDEIAALTAERSALEKKLGEADAVIWLLKNDGIVSGSIAARWHAEACARHASYVRSEDDEFDMIMREVEAMGGGE